MLTLTDANFQKEVLESKDPVLVDFWAPWCGPCKVMGLVFDEMAKVNAQQDIVFGKMNVDDNTDVASRFSVMSIPTLMLFKNGVPAEQWVGLQEKKDLQKKIKDFLKH